LLSSALRALVLVSVSGSAMGLPLKVFLHIALKLAVFAVTSRAYNVSHLANVPAFRHSNAAGLCFSGLVHGPLKSTQLALPICAAS